MQQYNDLLLTFNKAIDDHGVNRTPSASDEILIKTSNSCLYAKHGTKNYAPVTIAESCEWHLCMIGDLYSDCIPQNQQLTLFLTDLNAVRLNGRFLILAWNKLLHEWHIWTDRLGTFHAYFSGNDQRSSLGTFFPSVATVASQRKLDWLGLAGFFKFGFFPDDRTFYEDVQILQPASHYIYSEKGRLVLQKRYWNWSHTPDEKQTYQDSLHEFTSIFDQVMENMSDRGRIAVPISGGLDSRSTVASLFHSKQDKSRFWCYSYGYSPESIETRISRQIAKVQDLPFTAYNIQPYLFDQLEEILASVEGFQDITQCRQAYIVEDLKSHSDKVIAAHWGDVWLDTMGLDGKLSTVSDEKFQESVWKKFSKRGGKELSNIICGSHLSVDDAQEFLKNLLIQKSASLDHIQDPDFRLKAIKTDWWSFRWTLVSIRMFQNAAWPCLPFYDNRIVDFFCRTPSRFVKDRLLQIDYIKNKAPDLARITWQPYDANLYKYSQPDFFRLIRRAGRKVWRIATRQQTKQRNWEVQFLNPLGKNGLNRWLLHPGLRIHDLVPRKWINESVNNLLHNPEPILGYQLSMLLSFSIWLEMYG